MPRRAARKKPPSYIERSARQAGATISEPPTASQLLVWEPEQHVEGSKAQQREYWLDGGIWYAGNCLSATAPGERAAIYETGKGGVIGFWDFSGHAARIPGQRGAFMAPGFLRTLSHPIPHVDLVADGVLSEGRVTRRRLDEAKGQALNGFMREAGVRTPPFVRFWLPPELDRGAGAPERGWVRAGKRWLNESSLETQVAETARLWRKLGYSSPPERQRWITKRDRIDLYCLKDRLITEVKQAAALADLAQIVRYTAEMEKDDRKRWRGQLLSGRSVGRALAKSASESGVELWEMPRGGKLEQVA